MRHQSGPNRFRGAILAIAGMIAVCGIGAAFSYLLIESSDAAPSFGGVVTGMTPRDGWPGPDDMVDRMVATQLFQDVADWTGLENSLDQDEPDSREIVDPFEAVEIGFPLLTMLVVASTAQRMAEARPKRKAAERNDRE